jgi:hypothetical protein
MRASPSVTRRTALQARPLSTWISHYPRKLDRVYDEFVKAVDPGYRIDRRLSLAIPLPRAKAVGLKISRKDIPLSLLPDLRPAAICRVARNGSRDIDLGMSP